MDSGPRPAPAVELVDVSAGYGDVEVLRQINMTLDAGTALAMLGPNGAGKSTLLRTIAGFIRPTHGTLRIGGVDVAGEPPHRRFASGLCLVPEGRGIFRPMTVRDNIHMLAGSARGDSESIERAVDAFPVLGNRLGQVAGTLSGGQQQMLAMAAAHVRCPDLLLVDEASLGLAPVIVEEIFAFLAKRVAAGVTLLVVDQFVERALAIATRAVVLVHGEVVFDGEAADLGSDRELFERYTRGQIDDQRTT